MKKPSKLSSKNPSKKRQPLAPNKTELKDKSKKKKQRHSNTNDDNSNPDGQAGSANGRTSDGVVAAPASASAQLKFFLDLFQSANGIQLSSLELEPLKDTCILELSQCASQETESLGKDMMAAFGSSWKEILCGKRLLEGKVDPGNPAVLIISASALKSIDLLRGLRSLTKECHAVKLFSKHMKVEEQVVFNFLVHRFVDGLLLYLIHESAFDELEQRVGCDDKQSNYQSTSNAELFICTCELLRNLECDDRHSIYQSTSNAELFICTQGLGIWKVMTNNRIIKATAMLNCYLHVSLLKNRVNIASGTPSRIKKLIDIEALGLSRLAVIVLDIRSDVKGYSLLTLPQVRDEFWDLYKNYFHQRVVDGSLRLSLYGSLPSGTVLKGKKKS
ncbi:hypothetical protein CsatB_026448 [Cannabis sativa]